jgi:ABC-type nitrate/sulfonate/bicarbonate transport system substrate-binding protein
VDMEKHLLNRRVFLRASGAVALGGLGIHGARAQGTPAKKIAVTVVNAGGNPGLTLEELIKRLGYFDELGLEVKTLNVADSSKIISSLIAGDTDICMISGMAQTFPAIEKGARLKILAAANTLAPVSLFSAKPEIKALKDLEGRTIGTGAIGAALHQITVALFQKKGLDASKVNFVNVGTTGDILKAVAAGTVDAGTVNVDTYDQMAKLKIHPVADFFVELSDYPYQGSFASDNAIRNKREALVRTLAAYAKLYRFISRPDSRDPFVAAYVAATGGTASAGESFWSFVQKYKPYAVDLVVPDKNIDYVQRVNVETGVQKTPLPAKDVADMSLAAEAVKLI